MEWSEGEWIADQWKVSQVRRGGMGVVYVVYDAQKGVYLAAKTFQDRLIKRAPGALAAFRRECKAWILLDPHPNVVLALTVVLGCRPADVVDGRYRWVIPLVRSSDLVQARSL